MEVRGGWLRRWTMAGRVKRLWRLAYGPPVRVSLAEWRRLLRDVKQLKAALATARYELQGAANATGPSAERGNDQYETLVVR